MLNVFRINNRTRGWQVRIWSLQLKTDSLPAVLNSNSETFQSVLPQVGNARLQIQFRRGCWILTSRKGAWDLTSRNQPAPVPPEPRMCRAAWILCGRAKSNWAPTVLAKWQRIQETLSLQVSINVLVVRSTTGCEAFWTAAYRNPTTGDQSSFFLCTGWKISDCNRPFVTCIVLQVGLFTKNSTVHARARNEISSHQQ